MNTKELMMIGGTLINISEYPPDYNLDGMRTYELKFIGMNKEGSLYLKTSAGNVVSYQVGNFYKFNVRKYCGSIYSMESSGSYSDPNLVELQSVSCS